MIIIICYSIDFGAWQKIYIYSNRRERIKVACVAAVSFPFPGKEMERASEQAGERKSTPGVSKNFSVSFPSRAFLEALLRRLASKRIRNDINRIPSIQHLHRLNKYPFLNKWPTESWNFKYIKICKLDLSTKPEWMQIKFTLGSHQKFLV